MSIPPVNLNLLTSGYNSGMDKKKELTPEQKRECDALYKIWISKKNSLKLSYRIIGDRAGGITGPAVSHYLHGINPLNAKIAKIFADALEVQVSDFSKRLDKEIKSMTSANVIPLPQTGDIIKIPRFVDGADEGIRASMGVGATNGSSYVDVFNGLSIDKTWLRQNVNYSNPVNLAIITGYGDSMAGTFDDGDVLLVDRGYTEIKIDAVYVLSLGNELYIKRLQRRPDGTILMISDNPKYPPYEIKNGDIDTFRVEGRVLMAWNARKL